MRPNDTMRSCFVGFVIAILAAACGGPQTSSSAGGSTSGDGVRRTDLHCTLHDGDDPAACAARGNGCAMGPGLFCTGVEPPPEEVEAYRKSVEDSTIACQCVCDSDRTDCYTRP